MQKTGNYCIDIRFEEIKLPSTQEILVLGKNSPHGKIGILKSLEMLIPEAFEFFDVEHEVVQAVFIHKKILKRMPDYLVLKILKERVFPFLNEGDVLKVDFKITTIYNAVEIAAEQ